MSRCSTNYSKIKRYTISFLTFGVSAGLICWLISRIDYNLTVEIIVKSNWYYLSLAAFFTMCIPFFAVIRWKGVLVSQSKINISNFAALKMVLMASVLNSFLPSKTGDVAKAIFLRDQCGLSCGLGITVVERLVDFFVLGILGIVGFAWSGVYWGLISGSTILVAVIIVYISILTFNFNKLPFPDRLKQSLSNIRSVFLEWIRSPKAISQTLFGSLGSWTLSGLTICALGRGIKPDVDWANLLSVFPVAILAGLAPVTISGIGARDSVFILLFGKYMGVEEATLIGLGYTVLGYWFLAIMAIFVLGGKAAHTFIKKRSFSDYNKKNS